MNKLLLITGDIAAGKTTFSQILAKRYHVNAFNKDTIKEILGDTVGFTNRAENLKLSNATMELMIFIYSEFVKVNGSLILEANFHAGELSRLQEIAAKHGYETLTLALRGKAETLHQRYLNRMYHENRHPVHLSTTIDNFDDFAAMTERTRKEEICGNILYIDADDFSYQTDVSILRKIDGFMGKPLPDGK